jgi:hypothetical protein
MAAWFNNSLEYVAGLIPGVPSTGMFRLGDLVISNYDMFIFLVIILVLGTGVFLAACQSKRRSYATGPSSKFGIKSKPAARRKTAKKVSRKR